MGWRQGPRGLSSAKEPRATPRTERWPGVVKEIHAPVQKPPSPGVSGPSVRLVVAEEARVEQGKPSWEPEHPVSTMRLCRSRLATSKIVRPASGGSLRAARFSKAPPLLLNPLYHLLEDPEIPQQFPQEDPQPIPQRNVMTIQVYCHCKPRGISLEWEENSSK